MLNDSPWNTSLSSAIDLKLSVFWAKHSSLQARDPTPGSPALTGFQLKI
jgi:hypothetical protein